MDLGFGACRLQVQVPAKGEYTLTAKGRELCDLLPLTPTWPILAGQEQNMNASASHVPVLVEIQDVLRIPSRRDSPHKQTPPRNSNPTK